jgi:ribosomal protein L37AE/L43A
MKLKLPSLSLVDALTLSRDLYACIVCRRLRTPFGERVKHECRDCRLSFHRSCYEQAVGLGHRAKD